MNNIIDICAYVIQFLRDTNFNLFGVSINYFDFIIYSFVVGLIIDFLVSFLMNWGD